MTRATAITVLQDLDNTYGWAAPQQQRTPYGCLASVALREGSIHPVKTQMGMWMAALAHDIGLTDHHYYGLISVAQRLKRFADNTSPRLRRGNPI